MVIKISGKEDVVKHLKIHYTEPFDVIFNASKTQVLMKTDGKYYRIDGCPKCLGKFELAENLDILDGDISIILNGLKTVLNVLPSRELSSQKYYQDKVIHHAVKYRDDPTKKNFEELLWYVVFASPDRVTCNVR